MRAAPVGTKNKKRIALGFVIIALLLLLLTFRVAYWQIIKADWLTEKAIAQQTQDTPIEAKRGAIYDRNGKELATSITCYTLWARPALSAPPAQKGPRSILLYNFTSPMYSSKSPLCTAC